ncbi:MAG: hypothetical protein IJZ82_09775 [Lachnospiraceae bacterium]|nr:hypothetical protein [Lachnospiraceae bacterium]
MIFKCKNCGGNVIYSPEHKQMYCPYCDSKESQERAMEECDKQFCPNCGGEITVEEHTSALQCKYCDHYIILNDRVEGAYLPKKIIPFKLSKEMVKNALRQRFKKATFAPTDFLSEVRLNSMVGEYVPFWMYDYDVNCTYNAEGVRVRTWTTGDIQHTETSYYDVIRDMNINYKEIPVDASVKMPDGVMDLLEPYNYGEFVEFKPEFMSGFTAEKYNMESDTVEFRANDKMSTSASAILRNSVSGYSRLHERSKNFSVRNKVHNYNLLPAWKYLYTYKDKLYPFYVNGQTGKIVGSVPVSKQKVLAYGATLFALLSTILIAGGFIIASLGLI